MTAPYLVVLNARGEPPTSFEADSLVRAQTDAAECLSTFASLRRVDVLEHVSGDQYRTVQSLHHLAPSQGLGL